jgi:hypothetical protein
MTTRDESRLLRHLEALDRFTGHARLTSFQQACIDDASTSMNDAIKDSLHRRALRQHTRVLDITQEKEPIQ